VVLAIALQHAEYVNQLEVIVIVSDWLMPGIKGDEFLIKLHATYPRTLKILLTGQANANSVGNIVNQAALYRYIAKPWDETDLILTVKAAIKSYGQEKKIVRQNKLLNKSNNLLKQTNEKLSKSLELLLATFESLVSILNPINYLLLKINYIRH